MYPPFSEFINFVFSSKDETSARSAANIFYKKLMNELSRTSFSGTSFKPCGAPIYKINGKYRYHFILKTPYRKDIYDTINNVYHKLSFGKNDINVTIDVNPNSMY